MVVGVVRLWLGYPNASLAIDEIAAILLFQPALVGPLMRSFGRVPADARAVVVTRDGAYLPARRTAAALRAEWASGRARQEEQAS